MRAAALFLLGMVFTGLSNGGYATAFGPWLAVPCLLLFLDRVGVRRGLPLLVLGTILVHAVIWRGIIPVPGWLYLAIAGAYGLSYSLPYLVDGLAGSRGRRPWPGTLVFPAAWVAVELGVERLTPYGSWGALAYTQLDVPILIQSASLFGTAGIAFLVTWTGSTVAWVVARRRAGRAVPRWGWAVWGLAVVAAAIYGEARLRRPPVSGEGVRVALLAPAPELRRAFDREFWALIGAGGADSSAAAAERLRAPAEAVVADLVARTREEARAGAALVAWSETAAKVFTSDRDSFVERLGAVAAEDGIYLAAGVGLWTPGGSPPLRNVILAFDPDGRLAWTFDKAHPVVGGEASMVAAGDGVLPVWDTRLGRLTAVICHDLDFPPLLEQAGRMGADAVLAPADDWLNILWLHAGMATLRAVENGVTLLRPTYGISLAVDPEGRVLASGNTYAGSTSLEVTLPLRRRGALYPSIHDAFAWICLVSLLVLIPAARSGQTRRE